MPDYIPISSIIHDDLNFDEELLKPIRESIEAQGCHHPLLVQDCSFVDISSSTNYREVKRYKIIAGKKRLKCLQQLGTIEAPVKILSANLTSDQCEEYSLHENLRRYNLPWHEQVELNLKLHELRIRQNGKKKGPTLTINGKKGWTQADTAKELGISVGPLSEDLDLARAVRSNPSLSKVKDKTTALKLIKTEARRLEDEAFSLIPSEIEMDQVFLGDSLEILKQFPNRIFDACITDPPWSQYARDESLTAEPVDLLGIFKEVFRVSKMIPSCTSYAQAQTLSIIEETFQSSDSQCKIILSYGRKHVQLRMVDETGNTVGIMNPYYLQLKVLLSLHHPLKISSILSYPNLHYTKMIHPHEKPIALLNQLVRDCSYVGGKIIDPFSGSGCTLESCKINDRRYIGIEKEKKFFDNIVNRLK